MFANNVGQFFLQQSLLILFLNRVQFCLLEMVNFNFNPLAFNFSYESFFLKKKNHFRYRGLVWAKPSAESETDVQGRIYLSLERFKTDFNFLYSFFSSFINWKILRISYLFWLSLSCIVIMPVFKKSVF